MKIISNRNQKLSILSVCFSVIIFLSILTSSSFAQTTNPPATPADNQPKAPENNPTVQPPLELPTFIIEGVEHLNIKAGMKQFPSPPTVLSSKELDSINPLEKQQSLLVAPPQLPKKLDYPKYANGFVEAHAGLYSTFDLLAAYGRKYEGYELYGRAGLKSSSGDVKNSDFGKFFINLNSDYIAPEFFWVFGGSRTRTKASYSNSSFKNYGTIAATERSTNAFDISLVSDGNYEGFNFSTGAGFSSFNLDQKTNAVEETRINGFLNINTLFDKNLAGIGLDLNFGTFQGKSMNFIQIAATESIFKEKITIEGNFGYQMAAASDATSQNSFTLRANIGYLPNSNMSIRAEFFTGLEKAYYYNHFEANPYFDLDSNTMFFPKINLMMKAAVQYLPHTKLGVTFSGGIKLYDKYPYFNSLDSNNLELLFEKATIIFGKAEGFWDMTKKDKLNSYIGINLGTLDYKNNAIPYLPLLEASISSERRWFDNFTTELGIIFNSKRFSDRDNKSEINSYLNLFAKVNYTILDNLKVVAELQNLTNSDNFIWKGYKERGVFGTIGINWQF